MRTLSTVEEMQGLALDLRRDNQKIGLVPTMGYLHDGHISLIRKAREMCDVLVVSIFVNPIQFGPNEDLDSYPRDMAKDIAACDAENVDVVFTPDAESMYSNTASVFVDDDSGLSGCLCGASRPGHFKGVLTVVAKLFNIILPDIAVFGQKDAQQARLIEQMIKDLDFPIEMVTAPIVREPDGLAMSSRDTYLEPDERSRAVCLYESLSLAEKSYMAGERDAGAIKRAMVDLINDSGGAIDYVELLDYDSFKPASAITARVLVAVAVRFGSTRLIDNTVLG